MRSRTLDFRYTNSKYAFDAQPLVRNKLRMEGRRDVRSRELCLHTPVLRPSSRGVLVTGCGCKAHMKGNFELSKGSRRSISSGAGRATSRFPISPAKKWFRIMKIIFYVGLCGCCWRLRIIIKKRGLRKITHLGGFGAGVSVARVCVRCAMCDSGFL